jgi:molecular chaperone DnaK (HSP70)
MILQKLKQDAEAFLGEKATRTWAATTSTSA